MGQDYLENGSIVRSLVVWSMFIHLSVCPLGVSNKKQRNRLGCILAQMLPSEYSTLYTLTKKTMSDYFWVTLWLKCFDTVGWVSGRASGL